METYPLPIDKVTQLLSTLYGEKCKVVKCANPKTTSDGRYAFYSFLVDKGEIPLPEDEIPMLLFLPPKEEVVNEVQEENMFIGQFVESTSNEVTETEGAEEMEKNPEIEVREVTLTGLEILPPVEENLPISEQETTPDTEPLSDQKPVKLNKDGSPRKQRSDKGVPRRPYTSRKN